MAARLNNRHQDMVRDKIRASQLVNRLDGHFRGDLEMSLSQVIAAEVLLGFSTGEVPDLRCDKEKSPQYGNSGVYVVDAKGSGRIKIGWSNCVDKRVKELQTGCPFPMKILNVIDADDPCSEAWLHKRFSEYRVCGEWFEIPDRVIRFLCSLKPASTGENQDAEQRYAV